MVKDSPVHVTTQRRHYVGKDGVERVYETHLLRRSFREDGKVRNETVANLSHLPAAAITAVRSVLAGRDLVDAASVVSINRSVPHGHVAAVWAIAQQLGLPALLGPAGRMRDLALALIISRAVAPASKLATLTAWDDVTLGADLAVAGASTDEVYAAMDYLLDRQDGIEKSFAARYLAPKVNPSRMALYDLSSSWMTGTKCPLAKRGYSRDGKKGLPQIEYALLTDPAGCPVAVRVFEGNTADPTAFTAAVTAVKDTFALENMVMVGDRGMITTARITALKKVGGLGWLTALRAPQIAVLAADTGPLQMSLFDEQNFAEISHPDYPTERLVACRNPALADLRGRNRLDLLTATEKALAPIQAAVHAGKLIGAYKNLAGVEKDFRSLKAIDIDLRPVHHHLEHRVKAHVFLCFLAAHLTHHLRNTLAELTYTDENRPTRTDPVAPATTSQAAHHKTATHISTDGLPLHSYQGLLKHLATLTRNDLQYGIDGPVIPTLAEPTPVQRRVFQLIGAPIPTTLT